MSVKTARPIIIDNGSYMIKAGFGADEAPRAVFRPIVGRPKIEGIASPGQDQKDCYVGDEAQEKRSILNVEPPALLKGVVTNWADMEKVWHHTFYNELRISPEDHPILLTETIHNAKADRERMASIMFETFRVPSLFIAKSAVLSLYASGRLMGLVVDSGQDVTHAVPVHEGYCLPDFARSVPFGGKTLTSYMMKLLCQRGYSFTTSAERETARDIKEKLAYVAYEPLKESQSAAEYTLPDGNIVMVEKECFLCPEALFRPSDLGLEASGIQQLAYDAVTGCDTNLHEGLFANVVLAGGNTMFRGLAPRLEKELTTLNPNADVQVKITATPERKYSAWIGGSIFSSLPAFPEMTMSKQQYEESGPDFIHQKC